MKVWTLEEVGGVLEDRSFTHGLGVFETMLAVDGRLVAPELHFERLQAGCLRLGMAPPDESKILDSIDPVLSSLAAPRAKVRLMRTGGRGRIDDLDGDQPLTVLAVEAIALPPESVGVITSPWPRNEGSPLAGVKCSSYAENLVALDHVRKAGADELIFPNTRGNVSEAATANVFAVMDGTVVTPSLDCGCLPGTARRRVIDLATSLGLKVEEQSLPIAEAREADELFLTSATRGVVWVSDWDGRGFADRRVTERLRQAFDESLKGE
ncbi:4-amino-4-deoxychorismate lyase [Haloferula helveola]|uniref:branched-chain-amino-acid transaminase n=1 Tax=Haloferula helveola TaxID=490095 RepID=A0ABM7RP30_9BACT|nr:4-amino-4-deoxychorismate lyase [Haloferula helveola]